ncbi:MAG: AmmeMemoRadiSam system radical SAM enzyme [Thermoproteota archaeon]|nr:MAG: AmmeMemoRadiSam system radical SAM enzyme [Candidatus Korarchaeota archaeon]
MKVLSDLKTVVKSRFYSKLRGGKVRCELCERRCRIPPGEYGYCKTRVNIDGELFTVVYGYLSALESRPIEVKPFFHYHPGSTALTFSTWSCNFDCPWCQNHGLSKTAPKLEVAKFTPPKTVVEIALRNGDGGLCASFQEPTLLTDYNLEVFKLGSKVGLYSCYVSNGYMTEKVLTSLKEVGMDGLKIDVKGDPETYLKYCGGIDVYKIWKNAEKAKTMGFHVEIVNLIVTGVNDDEACLRFIVENHIKRLGVDTPIHFTRYYPAFKFSNPPTPVDKLVDAYQMAKKAGIKFPYIGNVLGHPLEDTYCPNCGKRLIKRFGFKVVDYKVTDDGKCPYCGEEIPIRT